MKQITNPFTGKSDHTMNRKEVAEELDMTLGQLNFRWSEDCKLNKCFIPPRRILHGMPKAILSEIRTFKENNKSFTKKPKTVVEKNTDKTNSSEIIDFAQKKK